MANIFADIGWVRMDVNQDSISAAVLFGIDHEPEIERLPGDLNPLFVLYPAISTC